MNGISGTENLGMEVFKKHRYWEFGLVAVMLFFEALCLQWLGGALDNEYTSFPDEAAHYVSALLVQDYLSSGDYSDPMGYAEDYYQHYPKVAIGHWPPFFYGLLGIWFVIFGVSRISSMCFMAAIAAGTGATIFYIARAHLSKVAALFAASLFIALPLTQQMSSTVMLEHLVTLLTLLSVVFLAKFLSTAQLMYGLLFSFFAAFAILTRGTAWSIGLIPIVTMLIAWRFNMLVRPIFWLSAIPVLVLCVPWYLAMPSVNLGAFTSDSIFDWSYTSHAIPWFAHRVYAEVGLVIFAFVVLGVWGKLIAPILAGRKVELIWAALAAMLIAIYTIHTIIPAAIAVRYMLTGMPIMVLFAAAGIEWLIGQLSLGEFDRYVRPVTYSLIVALFISVYFSIDTKSTRGFVPAYEEVAKHMNDEQHCILIASGVFGEGSIVAAAAAEKSPAETFILRGSKLLVKEDWQGRYSEDKFQSTAEISELLQSIPVDAVILDTALPENRRRKYHQQLKSVLSEEKENWQLIDRLPITKNGIKYERALLVFVSANANSADRSSKPINLDVVGTLYSSN